MPGIVNEWAGPTPVMMNPEQYLAGRAPPAAPALPAGPPTGLIGSEMALQGGYDAALAGLLGGYGEAQSILSRPGMSATASYDMGGVSGAIGQGVAGAGQAVGLGVQTLNPYAQPGVQSLNLQAALSGAMGAPAQQQAYANYQESPGQRYLREQSERALLRNSAAIGGLGGGNVRQELQRQAQGLAAQDFDAAFNRLGSITQTGFGAASNQAALRGQEAGIIGQLRGQEAGIAGNLEGQRMGVQGNIDTAAMANENARRLALAQGALTTGGNVGELGFQTGQSVAGGRTQAGRDIATSVGSTISALSNLANQGGADIAEQIGEGAGNLATVIAGAAAGQSGSQTDLAKLLANIIGGQGNQVAGLPGVPGVQTNPGILGNAGNFLQGVGAMMPQGTA